MTDPKGTDLSDDDGPDLELDEPDLIEKPPQIEAWKMEGAEDLPDEVHSSPIPSEAQHD